VTLYVPVLLVNVREIGPLSAVLTPGTKYVPLLLVNFSEIEPFAEFLAIVTLYEPLLLVNVVKVKPFSSKICPNLLVKALSCTVAGVCTTSPSFAMVGLCSCDTTSPVVVDSLSPLTAFEFPPASPVIFFCVVDTAACRFFPPRPGVYCRITVLECLRICHSEKLLFSEVLASLTSCGF